MTDGARILIASGVAVVFVGLLAWGWARGLKALYPELLARRPLRYAALAALGTWAVLTAAQPLLRVLELPRPMRLTLMAGTGFGLVSLVLTLPFLGLGVWLRRRAAPIEAKAPPAAEPSPAPTASPANVGLSRRELVLSGARLAPVGGVLLGASGARGGQAMAEVVEMDLAFPELPPALEGLKILQYSDVHLGHFIDLDEVRRLVELGRAARPDLVVLTGDIADDLALLPEALALFKEIGARHGVYGAIGNHEYFRGLEDTLRGYERAQVPLLLEDGATLDLDGARLHLSGADDPRYLGRQSADFFARTVDRALDGAPSDAFHVLLSHRPEGFAAAQRHGVHLTLSGHTHGAQVGINGRSLFEPLLPDKYLWGHYAEGRSRLYTSSGAGHWFPFRLGCPRELPVLRLVRGPTSQSPKKRRS